MGKFEGFVEPKANFSKLPHQFIEILPQIETRGEMAVILYILRHTWGFQDQHKKITLDEFENGRKRRDGTRIDEGTGLSRPTIVDGLARAEAHGFIEVARDESDSARVKKLYSLRMEGLRNLTPGVKKLYTRGKETLHRTEKETLERNSRKKPIDMGQASRQMFSTLAEICDINLDIVTKTGPKGRGALNSSEKILREAGIGSQDLREFRQWWNRHDWRGQKGQPPSPIQVRQEWGTFEKYRKRNQYRMEVGA